MAQVLGEALLLAVHDSEQVRSRVDPIDEQRGLLGSCGDDHLGVDQAAQNVDLILVQRVAHATLERPVQQLEQQRVVVALDDLVQLVLEQAVLHGDDRVQAQFEPPVPSHIREGRHTAHHSAVDLRVCCDQVLELPAEAVGARQGVRHYLLGAADRDPQLATHCPQHVLVGLLVEHRHDHHTERRVQHHEVGALTVAIERRLVPDGDLVLEPDRQRGHDPSVPGRQRCVVPQVLGDQVRHGWPLSSRRSLTRRSGRSTAPASYLGAMLRRNAVTTRVPDATAAG